MADKSEFPQKELVDQERHRFRKSLYLGAGFGLVLVAVVLWLFSLPQSATTATALNLLRFLPLGILVLILARYLVRLFWRKGLNTAAQDDSVSSKLIDERQAQGRWYTWIILLGMFMATLYIEQIISKQRQAFGLHVSGEFAAIFSLFPALLSLSICFGPGFAQRAYYKSVEDELRRSHRARAARLGYIVVMTALGALFLTVLYQPSLVTAALPIVMMVGGAVPLTYFQILEWRANRSV